MRTPLFVIGLLLGAGPSLAAQAISADRESAIARAALKPGTPTAVRAVRLSPVDTAGWNPSRGEATALGFLAGAGVGLVIAHLVNENKKTGGGKLENYIGIPLGLGLLTAATVFVAMGD